MSRKRNQERDGYDSQALAGNGAGKPPLTPEQEAQRELRRLNRPHYWIVQQSPGKLPPRVLVSVKSQRAGLSKLDEYAAVLGIDRATLRLVRVKQVYPEISLPDGWVHEQAEAAVQE